MKKAFVDTTILTDVLLKVGDLHDAAIQALSCYDASILPVFAIKEWKRGPLYAFVFLHNKLASTGSFIATNNTLSRMFMRPRQRSTTFEALAAATWRLPPPATSQSADKEIAERYRLALKSLIYESWQSRRSITTETVTDLDCYIETSPRDLSNGEIDIKPRDCVGERECCLADQLRRKKELLLKLRDSIPAAGGKEDQDRRKVLRQLAVHPNVRFERKDCRALGDAYFAIFAPDDAEILTTNLKDHCPLAEAIGKKAVSPISGSNATPKKGSP